MPEAPQLPPIAQAPLSVLLVATDARPHLDDILEKWARHLDKLQRDYELLLIDDGSTDGTAARAEALTTRIPRLRVLRHETRAGFGAALRTGLAAAQHPLVCYAACDPAYQPADVKLLLDHIDACHIVSGARAAAGSHPPWWYRWLARWVFGVRVRDVNCAFKLCRRDVFSRIPLQSTGPFVHVEILAKANFLGCVLDEAGVSYRPQSGARTEARLTLGQIARDARRVFNNPDFGPAVLPTATDETRAHPSLSAVSTSRTGS